MYKRIVDRSVLRQEEEEEEEEEELDEYLMASTDYSDTDSDSGY